tara:strand:+ start:1512 stop:3437 length:1926 start_codon:yes stop_codon:yes gene_type:complete
MPLTKLQFRPGVNRETTSYTNEGGWFNSDKVRFRFGLPEKIGGWQKNGDNSFLGTARSLHTWVTLSGTKLTGVGTSLKLYINQGGEFYDVTPIRSTTAAGDVTFSATNGSSVITVTDTNHGAAQNDFVTFSGAASLGGNITANVLNQEYQITEVVNVDSYKISARAASTTIKSITVDGQISATPVTANSSDTGNGGSSVVGKYQINTGLTNVVTGTGWGAGTWGGGTWGTASALTVVNTLRIWTQDNFGEDLLSCVRDGGIFFWDTSADALGTDRVTALASLTNADAETPTIAKQVLVSDRDRHVLVFGCDGETSIGTQDPLLIRFSSQESLTTWKAEATNTAGELRISSGSEIITAVETKSQVLVFTDVSVHSLQFLGPPFTFGVSQISENTTIMGPMAAKAVDDAVFWMGFEDFYVYNGQVQKLPCTVRSYVFNDFNSSQSEKVTAALNSSNSEVWWFYPSASSTEIDRYVIYNYEEKVWYFGTLPRTVWLDRGVNNFPLAASTDGYLYDHENGLNDGSTNPPTPMTSFIESSQLSIGEGNNFVFLSRLIPDITFDGSVTNGPSADFTLQARNFPGGQYLQTKDSAVTQSATTPVEQFTEQAFVRLRGRSFALKVQSDSIDMQWRLGTARVDARQDGRR